jgi:hypothetical protein
MYRLEPSRYLSLNPGVKPVLLNYRRVYPLWSTGLSPIGDKLRPRLSNPDVGGGFEGAPDQNL